MDRQMTLGRFIAIFLPLLFIIIGWIKVHEDRQDDKIEDLSGIRIEHEERIFVLEEFRSDVKVFQEKQDQNHIETLEAISGLTTNIEVLVERVKHQYK